MDTPQQENDGLEVRLSELYHTALEARHILGLSKDRFDYLIQTGVIEKPTFFGGTKGYFLKSHIQTLANQFEAVFTRQPEVKEQQPDKKIERVKRTFMLTPDRATWLKVQAALERREMSDIVEEALATYEQRHPRKQEQE